MIHSYAARAAAIQAGTVELDVLCEQALLQLRRRLAQERLVELQRLRWLGGLERDDARDEEPTAVDGPTPRHEAARPAGPRDLVGLVDLEPHPQRLARGRVAEVGRERERARLELAAPDPLEQEARGVGDLARLAGAALGGAVRLVGHGSIVARIARRGQRR